MRMVTLAGLMRPIRILSSCSCMTPCSVSPENPAKSIETCSRANACSMNGRMPTDGAARDLEAQITALLTARPATARRSWRRRDNRCPAPGHRQSQLGTAPRGRGTSRLVRRQPRWRPLPARPASTGSTAAVTGLPATRCGSSPTVRTISEPRTRAFVAERTATGNSRREIIRMLQRYIARGYTPSSSRPSAMTPSLVDIGPSTSLPA